jgi:signal transduction histidine kinase/ligand-binding sensor domain-containing protein
VIKVISVLRLRAILYALLFILPAQIKAQHQNYTFQHLTTKDGLASDLTKFIFQDTKGYFWLGYDNGFQKFDGKNFNSVSFNNKYIQSGILEGPVQKPIEDDAGQVYLLNQGTVYIYKPNGQIDTICLFDMGDDQVSDIYTFCKGENNTIWFVSRKGIYDYDKVNRKCNLWKSIEPKKISLTLTRLVYDSSKKCFWLARDDHIFRINLMSKTITEPFYNQNSRQKEKHENESFTTFGIDSDQNLWTGSWNGQMYKYNTNTYEKKLYDELNIGKNKTQTDRSIPICLLEDKQKKIWIGCNNGGLFCYDPQTDHFTPVYSNNNLPTSLHYNYSITFLYQDKEENIWIGTDRGINIFNPSLTAFNTVDENSPLSVFQKLEVTRIIETSSGNIIVGTWGKGWFLYDKNFRLIKQFYDANASKKSDIAFRKNLVWCFAEDKDKKVWIGYQYGLVGVFDPETREIAFTYVPAFEHSTIQCMRFDGKGNLWFGLNSGFLIKRQTIQNKFIVYKHALLFTKTPSPISDLLTDNENNLWVATNYNGFYNFDPESEKIITHYSNNGENSTFDNSVHSFTVIDDSTIAISTLFKGLILLNRKTKKTVSYTMQNGLPANSILGVAKDKQENMWIATGNGLCRMNKYGKNMATFDEEDGLLLKKFNGNIERLRNGMMVIPAETGFVYFDPDKIRGKSIPPDVQITGFTIFDKSLSVDSLLSKNNTIELKYDQNFFTIDYASLSFKGRNSTRYFYKLEGVDKNWIEAGTKRSTEYTDLNPGKYIFKINCENRDGVPSKNTSQILFIIHPPWWLTWWAYIFYALVIGSVVYVLYRSRITKIRKLQADQIRIMIATQEEERKRISRDLHDDVGTKLSALKLFLSSLKEKALKINDKEIQLLALNSEKYISETMKDIRQLLLNLSPAVLEEFGYITAVEGLVNKINETKQIRFNLVFFGMKHRLKKDYELALFRITQELINNVLKHAEAQNVALQIGFRDEKIILMIEDDGKGFEVKNHRNGYGLQNLEARTKMMEGSMTIDSQPGKGTTVLIEIPYEGG